MATGISVEYQGKLRCKAVLESNGQAVQTDVGVDHGGLGEFLSPVELTVAAVGACATSMMAVVAERSGVDVSSARTTASFEMVTSPARRLGSVQLTMHLPESVPESVRPKLAAAVKACPVKNSLHPDIRVDIELVYG
jgi:putative redox protein